MMGSFGCHSSLFWRWCWSSSWRGGVMYVYLITSPSVWSSHLTSDAIASLFTSDTFLWVPLSVSHGASFSTSRSLSLPPLSDLTRCLYEHLRIWGPENQIICHLLLLWASAHLSNQIICQGSLPLRHRLREYQHLFDGINCSPNSAKVPYFCWWGDHAPLLIPSAPNSTKVTFLANDRSLQVQSSDM